MDEYYEEALMDYLYILLSIPAAVYAWSFRKALKKQGNNYGAGFVTVLIVASIALPLYRLVSKP